MHFFLKYRLVRKKEACITLSIVKMSFMGASTIEPINLKSCSHLDH